MRFLRSGNLVWMQRTRRPLDHIHDVTAPEMKIYLLLIQHVYDTLTRLQQQLAETLALKCTVHSHVA